VLPRCSFLHFNLNLFPCIFFVCATYVGSPPKPLLRSWSHGVLGVPRHGGR
jgi:hypothetical protein